jgi:hypothetical protein
MPQAVEYIAVVDLKEKRITEFREKVIECDPEVSPLTVEEENLAVQIAEEFPLFQEVLVEGNMDIHTFDVRGVVARSSVKSEHRLAGVFFDCGDRAFLVNIDLTDQRGINVVLAKDYGTMASPYQRG